MCPQEGGLFRVTSEGPPGSPTHDSLDEVGVVARSDVYFQFLFVLFGWLDDETIGVGNLPHEISIVVQLEGRFEFGRPAGGHLFNFDFFFFWFDLH